MHCICSDCDKHATIHEMNLGLSQTCDWCNDRFSLDGCVPLHHIKSVKLQNRKRKNMRFHHVKSSLDKQTQTVPSALPKDSVKMSGRIEERQNAVCSKQPRNLPRMTKSRSPPTNKHKMWNLHHQNKSHQQCKCRSCHQICPSSNRQRSPP